MNVKKCVRALLYLYLTLIVAMDAVRAQTLKVGDTLPSELWSIPLDVVNHPEGKDCITLSEYKDKLIILDFWATWCGVCIKSMPDMDSLQKYFKESVIILPTSTEDSERVRKSMIKHAIGLPSIVNASDLKVYFPYRTVPHHVWINEGRVIAISNHANTSEETIEKALKGELVLKTKRDLFIGPFTPIYPYAVEQHTPVLIQSTLTGRIDGAGGVGSTENDSLQSHHQFNMPGIALYRNILKLPNNRIYIDTERIEQKLASGSEEYSYQTIAQKGIPKSQIQRFSVQQLDAAFGVKSELRIHKVQCVVLRDDKNAKKVINKENKNLTISGLCDLLNHSIRWSAEQMIFVNESSYEGPIHYESFKQLGDFREDIEALKSFMRPYGIEVLVTERELDFFIISEQ